MIARKQRFSPHSTRSVAFSRAGSSSPIYGEYYRSDNIPPAGYLSPSPFFFLTIGRASYFAFGVASLNGDRRATEEGAHWLRSALIEIGVGAKTAAGYGYWVLEEPPPEYRVS